MRVAYLNKDGNTYSTVKTDKRTGTCHSYKDIVITECDHNAYGPGGLSGLTSTITPKKHIIKCKYCDFEETAEHDEGSTCHCGYSSSEVDYYRGVTLNMTRGDAVTGATEPVATTSIVKIDTAFDIPECEYTPKGRRFTGWALNNTSVIKQPADTIIITAETALTAQYAELFDITRAIDGEIPNGVIDVNKYTADADGA